MPTLRVMTFNVRGATHTQDGINIMTVQTYQQLITESIKGLPPEILAEIADFVYFMRKRAFQPQAFEEELHNALLSIELSQLSRDEEAHLEQEFEDYEQRYPRE